jgi:hypothetical protein
MPRILQIGDRVRVASIHRWMPDRCGTIKQVRHKNDTRFLVKFDADELGLWHDDDGEPVLSLGDRDLVLLEEK